MADEKNEQNITAQPENNENLEKINKLKSLLQSEKSDLFEIISLQDKITFEDKNEEDQINNSSFNNISIKFFLSRIYRI